MPDTAAKIHNIVDARCGELLKQMQTAHPGADVGISVALYYPNDAGVPGFVGFGSAGPGIAVTDQTVYAIGSITKVFTATLAAYLSVRNVIGPLGHATVAPYLANGICNPAVVSGRYWQRLTFEKLATQTSGMPDQAIGQYSTPLFVNEPPSCQLLEWWNAKQASFSRHERSWIYSNAGFVTLGFAVAGAAKAGGLTAGYTTLLAEVITTPVGMPNTFAAACVPSGAVLAQGYTPGTKAVPITNAADLKSSAQDMLAWLAAVYGAMQRQASGGTLTPLQQAIAQTARVWIAHPETPDKQPIKFAMGLGWQIPMLGTAQALTKDGATSTGGCTGWVGLTRYDPSVPPAGIALLTNQDGVYPDGTARTILEEIIALG